MFILLGKRTDNGIVEVVKVDSYDYNAHILTKSLVSFQHEYFQKDWVLLTFL